MRGGTYLRNLHADVIPDNLGNAPERADRIRWYWQCASGRNEGDERT